jgi:hypothetical protein
MRGCLTFVLFVALLIGGLAFGLVQFALPALVDAAVRNSTLVHGQPVTVITDASIEGVFLDWRIDRIDITGRDLTEPNARVGNLNLTLRDVALVDRTFASASGELSDVDLQIAGVPLARVASVGLTGTSTSIQAGVLVTASAAEAAIRARLQDANVPVQQVRLGAGRIDITIAGQVVSAQPLLTSNGLALDVGAPVPPIELVSTPPGGEWRIDSVLVSPAGIRMSIGISLR